MRVLVAHSSKHGSTTEIAERVTSVLGAGGLDAECRPAAQVASLDGYDALVLGAAVYAGSWRRDAAAFVDRVAAQAPSIPAWVFSSGPVGDPPKPAERPTPADATARRLDPRDHVIFPGVVDRSRLSFVERGMVTALKVPDGDYRDWDAIEAWAAGVAAALTGAESPR